MYQKDNNGRHEYSDNLIPLVLSPDARIFRGYRGFSKEDTLVLIKTDTGWKAHFFENSDGQDDLGERIDKWMES